MIRQLAAACAAMVATAATSSWGEEPDVCEQRSEPCPPRPDYDRILTISGGISLGVYEAGYNWAFVRYLRTDKIGERPRSKIVGVTGASAGNINAFLTALAWCQSPAAEDPRPERSLFWMWTRLGIEELLPAAPREKCTEYYDRLGRSGRPLRPAARARVECRPDELAYEEDDGLLTRRAFRPIEVELQEAMALGSARKAFLPDCRLPIGVTVTKVTPGALDIEGQLSIPTQRFAVTMMAKTRQTSAGGTELNFYAGKDSDGAELIPRDKEVVGKYLELPTFKDGRLPATLPRLGTFSLFDVIEASAAFPVAFGPKMLNFCEEGANASAPSPEALLRASCPPGSGEVVAKFMDGGLLDNVPLGLATRLLKEDPVTKYHYMAPSTRRPHQWGGPITKPDDPDRDLDYLTHLVLSSVEVARQYELQTVARQEATRDAKFAISSRYPDITGDQLGSFGAFAAQPFREYDFYAGVYDALNDFAVERCSLLLKEKLADASESARCIVREIEASVSRMGLDQLRDSPVLWVVRKMLEAELRSGQGDPKQMLKLFPEGDPPSSPVLQGLVELGAARALALAPAAKSSTNWVNGFQNLVTNLKQKIGDPRATQQFTEAELELMSDPNAWLWKLLQTGSARLYDIEVADEHRGGRPSSGRSIFALSELVARTELAPGRQWHFTWSPGGFDSWADAFPNYAILYPMSGGFELGYRPTYDLNFGHSLTLQVIPVSLWSHQHLSSGAGLMARQRVPSLIFSSFEVGARLEYDWFRRQTLEDQAMKWAAPWRGGAPDRLAVAPEVAAYLLAGKVRVGLLVRPRADPFPPWQWQLSIGFSELSGIFHLAMSSKVTWGDHPLPGEHHGPDQ